MLYILNHFYLTVNGSVLYLNLLNIKNRTNVFKNIKKKYETCYVK